ncbi:MAG: ABC transporter permease, partial [Chlamydiia bacterium]|nr:ABC transporter permease [Chlamydiia bacterium]
SNLKLIFRTLWISLTVTGFCLLIAVPVGYTIARTRARLQQILLLLVVIPFWTSFIVRIYAWKSLLHPEGLLKTLLLALNLVDADTVFLYNSAAVVLVMVYTYVPFAILPVYAASSKFDEHLFEAAMDLGMTRLKAFFKVFLPCIQTGMLTAVLLVLIPCLGAYVIPDVIGGPDSMMIGNRIVQKTFVERDIPLASALSTLLSAAVLIPMAITMILQARTDKAHAVKGGH